MFKSESKYVKYEWLRAKSGLSLRAWARGCGLQRASEWLARKVTGAKKS